MTENYSAELVINAEGISLSLYDHDDDNVTLVDEFWIEHWEVNKEEYPVRGTVKSWGK